MKSIRIHAFGGPEVLKLEELPDPTPGPGQIVVHAKAIGINPVDTYIRAGKYGPRLFPFTPGTDAGGVVEKVGGDVKSFKPGDRVYVAGSVSGAYAEKILCEEKHVHPLPEQVSFAQGAAMGVAYATAYRGVVIRGAGKAGETILIHGGSGGVGTAAIQVAKAIGLTVFATAGTDDGLKLVIDQGADRAFNHREKDYLDKITQATGGQGVSLIIELVAHINLDHDLKLLAKFGRVVVIGSRGPIEIDPRQTMMKELDIRGMSLNNASEAELRSIHAGLAAGLANRTLVPVIGKEMPLADAAKAHEAVMKDGAHGKIVLVT